MRLTPVIPDFATTEAMEVHFRSPNGRMLYVLLATVADNGAIVYTLRTGGTYSENWDSFVGDDRWSEIPRKAREGWQRSVLDWIRGKYLLELVV